MEDWPPNAPDPTPPSDSWPPPPPGEPPPAPPPATVIPWEQPGLPWATALVATVKLLFTKPRETFESMPIAGDVLRPFVFAILLGWVGAIFSALWSIPFRSMMPAGSPYGSYQMPAFFLPLIALFAPVLIVCALLVGSAIQHLMLMIVGGARSGFAVARAAGAVLRAGAPVFQALPFCGSLIAAIAAILLTIQGLAVAHRISLGKATLAVLLPVVLCCVCICLFAVTRGAAMMAHFSEGTRH
jgi:hypothetical protein